MGISFFVHGRPQPQGSSRAFMAGGRPIITSTNKNLGDWRRLIADQAQTHALIHEGGVEVALTFFLPRPKSAKKGAVPTKRPDLDKLIRSCLDALTNVMWHDDSQVTRVIAEKFYEDEHQPAGVLIEIGRA